MNILIVEDEVNLRNSLSELLRFNDYNVSMAEDGVHALSLLSSGLTPDLIISDIIMPEMDGVALLKNLQEDDRLRFIPFIFLTARAELEEIRMGMGLGADDYITKPVKYADLIAAVELRLKKKSSLVENITQKVSTPARQNSAARIDELKEMLDVVSPSERRVLEALSDNKISKVVAEQLFLSIKTVQNHRSHMAAKLGMSGQNSLLAFAVECRTFGLI